MVYGIFSPYNVSEVAPTDSDSCIYATWYPREYRDIFKFSSMSELKNHLECHAIAAASIIFSVEDEDAFDERINHFHDLFDNEEWVEEHIVPYV